MNRMYILNGPDIGQVFHIKTGISYLGRGSDNDIEMSDKSVSRRHLRIVRVWNKVFITDMKSRNGTFYDGKYLRPGIEVEVKEGTPIATGITLICIGDGCIEELMPFQEMSEPTNIISKQSMDRRQKSDQRKEALLQKVCDVLMRDLPVREAAQEILAHIFELLERIDRAAFILTDAETKEIKDIFFKTKNPADNVNTVFCRGVLNRVVEDMNPLAVLDAQFEEDTELADTLKVSEIESVMCVPLISHRKVMGALYVDSLRRPCGFRREDLCLFLDLSQRIAFAINKSIHARESGR